MKIARSIKEINPPKIVLWIESEEDFLSYHEPNFRNKL